MKLILKKRFDVYNFEREIVGLEPGEYELERVMPPNNLPQVFWLVVKEKNLGQSEGAWRQWLDPKFDDIVLLETEEEANIWKNSSLLNILNDLASDLDILEGKIWGLRIEYSIVKDQPFYSKLITSLNASMIFFDELQKNIKNM